ncbi:hypothetical protein CBS101457_005386 [Exobasidium rhododendri]|nr:hypothetical protein CBS101457_005386 [Exobasidium rhododendri]
MISNGFQARILDGTLESIEETFAILPALRPLTTDVPGEEQIAPIGQAHFPFVDLDGYSAELRAEALQVVRRGAIQIPPYSGSTTPDPVMASAPVDSSEAILTSYDEQTVFYLAFRWIGSEHANAESANLLGNLADANLNTVQGVGLMRNKSHRDIVLPKLDSSRERVKGDETSSRRPLTISKTKEEEDSLRKKEKEKSGSSFLSPSYYFKKKGSSKSQLRIEKVLEATVKSPGVEEHPFLVEFYFDNRAIPLATTAPDSGDNDQKGDKRVKVGAQTSMLLQGGALVDLGVIGSAMPDAPAKEILHTITMHLWDATRGDVAQAVATSVLDPKQQDLKKMVVPNVIFHFEIISSGPKSASVIPVAKRTSRRISLDVESLPSTSPPLEEEIERSRDVSVYNEDGRGVKLTPVVEESAPEEGRSAEVPLHPLRTRPGAADLPVLDHKSSFSVPGHKIKRKEVRLVEEKAETSDRTRPQRKQPRPSLAGRADAVLTAKDSERESRDEISAKSAHRSTALQRLEGEELMREAQPTIDQGRPRSSRLSRIFSCKPKERPVTAVLSEIKTAAVLGTSAYHTELREVLKKAEVLKMLNCAVQADRISKHRAHKARSRGTVYSSADEVTR